MLSLARSPGDVVYATILVDTVAAELSVLLSHCRRLAWVRGEFPLQIERP